MNFYHKQRHVNAIKYEKIPLYNDIIWSKSYNIQNLIITEPYQRRIQRKEFRLKTINAIKHGNKVMLSKGLTTRQLPSLTGGKYISLNLLVNYNYTGSFL